MRDTEVSLDLFEDFVRVVREAGAIRATMAGMSVEFPPEAPQTVVHEALPPLTNDGPPRDPDPAPAPTRDSLYSRLFNGAPPSFRRKD